MLNPLSLPVLFLLGLNINIYHAMSNKKQYNGLMKLLKQLRAFSDI